MAEIINEMPDEVEGEELEVNLDKDKKKQKLKSPLQMLKE